jgi:hypothetical protein
LWSGALRNESSVRRVAQASAFAVLVALPVVPAHAGFFDFLFGQQQPAPSRTTPAPAPSSPATFDPFGQNTPDGQPLTTPYDTSGQTAAYCVRTCDGRYFPIQSPTANAAQLCQSFCPASITKVFFGSSIAGAQAYDGAHYTDLANAYVYRSRLTAGCTCNGQNGRGLAPVDLSLDQTLRPGDVVATTTGLVAYNGGRTSQATDFTPVNSYAGLTADVRARLGALKVVPIAPIANQSVQISGPDADITASIGQTTSTPAN